VVLQYVRPLRIYYRGSARAVLDEACRILRVSRRRASEVNDEAACAAPFPRETGAFGAEIYFRAQVFHKICTPHRHLFHSLKRA
jgi:hypothetical protein